MQKVDNHPSGLHIAHEMIKSEVRIEKNHLPTVSVWKNLRLLKIREHDINLR